MFCRATQIINTALVTGPYTHIHGPKMFAVQNTVIYSYYNSPLASCNN